jgi:hypothetical protein
MEPLIINIPISKVDLEEARLFFFLRGLRRLGW